MKFIAADDERLALEGLIRAIYEAEPDAEIVSFRVPEDVIEYAKENTYDVAFLDIEMGTMDGLTLAKALKEIRPEGDIVFATGYSQYAVEAFKLRAAGYLMKPIMGEDVTRELNHIKTRNQVKEEVPGLSAKCFGTFELFFDEQPIKFRYSKTKELLAYLICRKGAFCSNGEIMACLWEDKEDTPSLFSNLRNLISDMNSTLRGFGCEEAVIKRRGNVAIDTSKISCDYYKWLAGDIDAINSYNGEFMKSYEWAEFSLDSFDDF